MGAIAQMYMVYQHLRTGEFRVFREDEFVIAIYAFVFGPASCEECDHWIEDSRTLAKPYEGGFLVARAGGGDHPVPLLTRSIHLYNRPVEPFPLDNILMAAGYAPEPSLPAGFNLWMDAIEVSLAPRKAQSPWIVVSLKGHVPSTGWRYPILVPQFKDLPEDGVLEFSPIGQKPSGIVNPKVSDFSANWAIQLSASNAGVRIPAVVANTSMGKRVFLRSKNSDDFIGPTTASNLNRLTGILGQGTECRTLVTGDGQLYSIALEEDYPNGAEIQVTALLTDASICMEGRGHLVVLWSRRK